MSVFPRTPSQTESLSLLGKVLSLEQQEDTPSLGRGKGEKGELSLPALSDRLARDRRWKTGNLPPERRAAT